MKFRNFLKNKKQSHQVKTLKEFVERKHCLCFFSVSNNGQIKIVLNKDESALNETHAEEIFNMYIKKNQNVHFYNYRLGLYKSYSSSNGKVVQHKIKQKNTNPVDMDSLIATIYFVGSEEKNNQLPPEFFPIIYKLLVDEVIGSGYKDIKATSFRNLMKKNGFTTDGRSSFSKYKPHGIFPNWCYDNTQFKKDTNRRKEEALSFARKFVKAYNDLKLQSETNKTNGIIETAEETAE